MKNMTRRIQFGLLNLVLIAPINDAAAKEHKQKMPANASQVVAHITFSGQAVIDMAMQKDPNNKMYLYVQH